MNLSFAILFLFFSSMIIKFDLRPKKEKIIKLGYRDRTFFCVVSLFIIRLKKARLYIFVSGPLKTLETTILKTTFIDIFAFSLSAYILAPKPIFAFYSRLKTFVNIVSYTTLIIHNFNVIFSNMCCSD